MQGEMSTPRRSYPAAITSWARIPLPQPRSTTRPWLIFFTCNASSSTSTALLDVAAETSVVDEGQIIAISVCHLCPLIFAIPHVNQRPDDPGKEMMTECAVHWLQ